MPGVYSIKGSDTNTDATTILGLICTANVRPQVFEFQVGSRVSPVEQSCGYRLQRYTGAGTGTGVTPYALDPADPTAEASAAEAHSGEPTYGAQILLECDVHQRTSYRWVADPDAPLILPATADNGLGVLCVVPSTAFAVDSTIFYRE